MACFWVRGVVNGKVRARLAGNWAVAVAVMANMVRDGVVDVVIHPMGRIEQGVR